MNSLKNQIVFIIISITFLCIAIATLISNTGYLPLKIIGVIFLLTTIILQIIALMKSKNNNK